ncbi:MAG: hypothetical protein ACRDIC_05585 [bacterium]
MFKGTINIVPCWGLLTQPRNARIGTLNVVLDSLVTDPEGDGPCAWYAKRQIDLWIVPDTTNWTHVRILTAGTFLATSSTTFADTIYPFYFVPPDPQQRPVPVTSTNFVTTWTCYDDRFVGESWTNDAEIEVTLEGYSPARNEYIPIPQAGSRASLVSQHTC